MPTERTERQPTIRISWETLAPEKIAEFQARFTQTLEAFEQWEEQRAAQSRTDAFNPVWLRRNGYVELLTWARTELGSPDQLMHCLPDYIRQMYFSETGRAAQVMLLPHAKDQLETSALLWSHNNTAEATQPFNDDVINQLGYKKLLHFAGTLSGGMKELVDAASNRFRATYQETETERYTAERALRELRIIARTWYKTLGQRPPYLMNVTLPLTTLI